MRPGKLARDESAWLLACTTHGCWRKESRETGWVCRSKLEEPGAFDDAAETDGEGMMMKLLWLSRPQLH